MTGGESKRLVDEAQIEKAVAAMRSLLTKTSESKKTKSLLSIMDDDSKVQLQFSYKQVPKIERTNVKVVLKHPVVGPMTTVCLFVKDLDKTREYEKSVRKYAEIFATCGVTQQIEFFPLKRLKLEFTDFEAKRNLSNMFDVYLADSRITRLLPAHLGKHFIGRKRFPLQVRLDSKDLKAEINKALHTSECVLSGKGSTCQICVGHMGHSDKQLVENIAASLDKLSASVPGGCVNIRNVVIKTNDSKAIPLYLSLDSKDEVELPRRRRLHDAPLAEDVTTVLGAKVSVNSRGVVKVITKGTVAKGTKRAKVAKTLD